MIADVAHGVFRARHPADVKALDGQEITVSGFMLKTDIMKNFSTFILSRYILVCPFCPPGAPNEAIDVSLHRFLHTTTTDLVTVNGRLHLHEDATTGLFFSLDQADIVERPA